MREAATERVFGFEIMPAPFVVAHLQVGLTMHDLDAPLADDGTKRAQIFLTNALTGWEPRTTRPLPFPELEEERDRSERVKQKVPILVILGNPPYNGFAGMAVDVEDLFYHVLAVLHDSAYRNANAGALRMEWPRIPLPGWPDGGAKGGAESLAESAARGRVLAALLDLDTAVPGVTEGTLRPEVAVIAVPATTTANNMAGDDFAVTVDWGHYGQGGAVMPGQGRLVERACTPDERGAFGNAASILGETTFDVYLNDRAFWRNVPAAVWRYKLGGYQVLKKWLSYRERDVLGRTLSPEEVQHFADAARRIAAILDIGRH